MNPLFLEVYTARVTLILIDFKPEFIIKFEQDMLQGKSIMQMKKKKKASKRKNKKVKMIPGEHPSLAHREDYLFAEVKSPGLSL